LNIKLVYYPLKVPTHTTQNVSVQVQPIVYRAQQRHLQENVYTYTGI